MMGEYRVQSAEYSFGSNPFGICSDLKDNQSDCSSCRNLIIKEIRQDFYQNCTLYSALCTLALTLLHIHAIIYKKG